ncbi:hypothetical protein LAUMK13_00039 [Mycobacterium innocens]|uniref:Uncharacterized protein n=1 Tax=Mycobacterium innocens TaxID=2341083 RepID=A0A498PMZ6_9MYCO|nr:hypothetical protein LAUMK13_00039 [Mycobacterium innocens]
MFSMNLEAEKLCTHWSLAMRLRLNGIRPVTAPRRLVEAVGG